MKFVIKLSIKELMRICSHLSLNIFPTANLIGRMSYIMMKEKEFVFLGKSDTSQIVY